MAVGLATDFDDRRCEIGPVASRYLWRKRIRLPGAVQIGCFDDLSFERRRLKPADESIEVRLDFLRRLTPFLEFRASTALTLPAQLSRPRARGFRTARHRSSGRLETCRVKLKWQSHAMIDGSVRRALATAQKRLERPWPFIGRTRIRSRPGGACMADTNGGSR